MTHTIARMFKTTAKSLFYTLFGLAIFSITFIVGTSVIVYVQTMPYHP